MSYCHAGSYRYAWKMILTVHSFDWREEEIDGIQTILSWCLDRNSRPHLIRFIKFPCIMKVEVPSLPGGRVWNEESKSIFITWIKTRMRNHNNHPTTSMIIKSKRLYYHQNGDSYYILLAFNTRTAMESCVRLLKEPINIEKFGYGLRMICMEHEISSIRKLLTVSKCQYCQWFSVEVELLEEGKLSNVDEYVCEWNRLKPIAPEETVTWATNPKVFSYDIEAYSSEKNKMPNEDASTHLCYMISVIVKDYTENKITRYLLLRGECNPIEGVTVMLFDSEVEMLKEFAHLMVREDPTVIVGYNILGFDDRYMNTRLTRTGNVWPTMGRLIGRETTLTSFSWESSAYGEQKIEFFNAHGRLNLDLLPNIRRDSKLPKYSLDVVANHFLGEGKHDMSAVRMFEIYERQLKVLTSKEPIDDKNEGPYYPKVNVIDGFSQEGSEYLNGHCELAYPTVTAMSEGSNGPEGSVDHCELAYPTVTTMSEGPEGPEGSNGLEYPTVTAMSEGSEGSNGPEGSNGHCELAYPTVTTMSEGSNVVNGSTILLAMQCIDSVDDNMPIRRYKEPHELSMLFLDPQLQQELLESRNEMTEVARYCVQDSELPIKLMEKLHTWIGLIEMSNVVGVNVIDLYTRGQQIRVMSQLYDLCHNEGYTIDRRESREVPYAGAFVADPTPGLYEPVIVSDFKSLYPSIIEGYNMCYTTLLKDSQYDTVPDDMCNTIHCIGGVSSGGKTAYEDCPDWIDIDSSHALNPEEININDAIQGKYGKMKKVIPISKWERIIECENETIYERTVKFMKEPKGILPKMVRALMDKRASTRKKQKAFPKGSIEWVILEKRQLALKVSANSVYGTLGAQRRGKLSLVEAAFAVTTRGRELISSVNKSIVDGIRIGPMLIRGKVVYGDTDSTMFLVDRNRDQLFPQGLIDPAIPVETEVNEVNEGTTVPTVPIGLEDGWEQEFPDIHKALTLLKDAEESGDKAKWNKLSLFLGAIVEREINKGFPPPIELESDPPKVLFCIKKKKYAGYIINADGTVDNSERGLVAKGITIARRDNCPLLREIYTKVLRDILDSVSLQDILNYLNTKVQEIITGLIGYKEFIMIKGVSTNYKSDKAVMKVFSDELAKLGHPVSAGDRLEFVYYRRNDTSDKLPVGQRMMTPEIFLREQYRLDYHYYLTNVIQKPIDQLLQVGFMCLRDTKETPVKVMIKSIDTISSINRCIRSLIPLERIPELYPVKIQYVKYKNKLTIVAISTSPLVSTKTHTIFTKREPIADHYSLMALCSRINERLQERLYLSW